MDHLLLEAREGSRGDAEVRRGLVQERLDLFAPVGEGLRVRQPVRQDGGQRPMCEQEAPRVLLRLRHRRHLDEVPEALPDHLRGGEVVEERRPRAQQRLLLLGRVGDLLLLVVERQVLVDLILQPPQAVGVALERREIARACATTSSSQS